MEYFILFILILIPVGRFAFKYFAFGGNKVGGYKLIPFLSEAEKRFLSSLEMALPRGVAIAVKPRLADIFTPVKSGDKSVWQRAFNRIACKHVDFLLLDSDSNPIMGIELDDKSHKEESRMERDNFVDGVFASAGLPILHVPAKRSYQTADISAAISDKLTPARV